MIDLTPGPSDHASRPIDLENEVGDAAPCDPAFATFTPFTSRATVVSCTASPIAIVCFGAVMTTDRTDAGRIIGAGCQQ